VLGISQADMARLAGTTPGHWSEIEAGKRLVHSRHLISLHLQIKADPTYILTGER
jgi:transcriptional regulator with XRE-family HTH domain